MNNTDIGLEELAGETAKTRGNTVIRHREAEIKIYNETQGPYVQSPMWRLVSPEHLNDNEQ